MTRADYQRGKRAETAKNSAQQSGRSKTKCEKKSAIAAMTAAGAISIGLLEVKPKQNPAGKARRER